MEASSREEVQHRGKVLFHGMGFCGKQDKSPNRGGRIGIVQRKTTPSPLMWGQREVTVETGHYMVGQVVGDSKL